MEKLTRREEELMRCFWERGPLFVRELVAMAPEPKPHFNTLSTMVRALEAKGYVGHTAYGSTYQYYPLVSEAEFSRSTLGNVISRYFENSYLGAVSALVEEEKISVDELRELIERMKVGACLAVFYLFFKLLLSRETFHRLNRAVVLGALLLSFVLPLCVITVYREAPVLPEIRPALLAAAAEDAAGRAAEPAFSSVPRRCCCGPFGRWGAWRG